MLTEKIKNSHWWASATICHDRHYEVSDGVMLSGHLLAVAGCIEKLFDGNSSFHAALFVLAEQFGLNRERMRQELLTVALLHDIGKTQDDKRLQIEHPLRKILVPKRHPIVGMVAAKELLDEEDCFTAEEKLRIFRLIEEHDAPYALYRQYQQLGSVPGFKSWKKLNDKVDERAGVGLLYLLLFKLADIDGHDHVEDVLWFFRKARSNYYKDLGRELPVPVESDIR